MKRKLIGKWHVAAFLVFCFVFALTASGVFYNQRGKLAGEFGNMVAANLTSYTQAQKRYLNSSITDAWNTLKGISGLVEQIIRMFDTGQSPVTRQEMTEVVRFLEAAGESLTTGREVVL